MTNGLFVTCYKNKQLSSFRAITHELSDIFGEHGNNEKLNLFSMEIRKKVKEEFGRHGLKYVPFKNISNIYFIDNKTSTQITNIADELKNKNIKNTHNILALDLFIEYNETALKEITTYLDEKIKNISNNYHTFKIAFKQRCTNLNIKEILFSIILAQMQQFKVDLTQPDITVHVQVVKNYVGMYLEAHNK